MKPAPFEYRDPETLDEALEILAEHGADARPLAGGQSLVPLMNFRLARPAVLVDLNRIAGLETLRRHDGVLRIGALVRSAALERSPLVEARWPLLREATRLSGHPQIRSRGTAGGSVAHADPASELPAALAALGARFHLRSLRGPRALTAFELLLGHYTTAIAPDELLVEIEVPALAAGAGAAIVEHARVHGDFALAGVAAVLEPDTDGGCRRASVWLLAAGPTAVRAAACEELLAGARLGDEQALREAARRAADAVQLGAEEAPYRRALVRELAVRALSTAAARVREAA